MPDSNFVFEQGEPIEVGSHGDSDFVFHQGEPVVNSGASELVFEAGVGLGDGAPGPFTTIWKNTSGDIPNWDGATPGEYITADASGNVYFFNDNDTDNITIYDATGSKVRSTTSPDFSEALSLLTVNNTLYLGAAHEDQFRVYTASDLAQQASRSFGDSTARAISTDGTYWYLGDWDGLSQTDELLNPTYTDTSFTEPRGLDVATNAGTLIDTGYGEFEIRNLSDGSLVTTVNLDEDRETVAGAGPDNFYIGDNKTVEQYAATDGAAGWTTTLAANVLDAHYHDPYVIVGRDDGQITVLNTSDGTEAITFDTGESFVSAIEAYDDNGKLAIYAADFRDWIGLFRET